MTVMIILVQFETGLKIYTEFNVSYNLVKYRGVLTQSINNYVTTLVIFAKHILAINIL